MIVQHNLRALIARSVVRRPESGLQMAFAIPLLLPVWQIPWGLWISQLLALKQQFFATKGAGIMPRFMLLFQFQQLGLFVLQGTAFMKADGFEMCQFLEFGLIKEPDWLDLFTSF